MFRDKLIVEWLKKGLYHLVQFVSPNLLLCGIFFQLFSWLLSSCPSFQRRFFQKKLFQVIRSIKVRLVAGRLEDRLYLLPFQLIEIDRPEKRVVGKRVESSSTDPLFSVLLE